MKTSHVLITLLAAAFVLPACGGAQTGRRWSAVDELPQNASAKALGHAERCDDGDLKDCQWMGIWYAVGGGGRGGRHKARKYFDYACNNGLNSSCKLRNNTAALARLGNKRRRGGAGNGPIRAVAKLPGGAPPKIRQMASRCDMGVMKACHGLGAWYMLGGAGKNRKVHGVQYTAHACRRGYQPACDLIRKLKAKLRERQNRGM